LVKTKRNSSGEIKTATLNKMKRSIVDLQKPTKMNCLKLVTLSIALLFMSCSSDTVNKETDNTHKEACCAKESSTKTSESSEITCPECGHKKTEVLPTDVCAIKYTCEKCKTELTPKDGDCCVFCTYGTHKCPSMQEE
jgi:hypothetical protein